MKRGRLILVALVAAGTAPAAISAGDGPVITLSEAVRVARQKNPSFLGQKEKLNQANEWKRKALALFLPQWSAAGTYTRFNKEVSFEMPDMNSFYFNPLASPPFGFERSLETAIQKENSFGASTTLNLNLLNMSLFPRYAAVGAQVKAAELSTLAYENEFVYGVVSAYYAALGARKILAITRQGVTVAEAHFAAAKSRFEAGDAPKLALLRSEIELEKARQDLRRAENGYSLAREALAVLLDRDAAFDVADADNVPGPATVGQGEAEAVRLAEDAVRLRPDVAAAEAAIASAEKGKEEIWYRFLPTLQASGTLRYSDSLGFIGDDYQWFVTLTAVVSLYDGGIRYADLREKQSAIAESTLALASVRSSIRGQVRQTMLEIDTCGANIASASKQVELARETHRVAKVNFDLGLASSSDVTDANAALSNADLNLAREELNCQLGRLKLLKVLGTIREHYK
ncbi:MAG: TolC family protein [Deltaproteobacteria bacterium]|nr:TolC family protein [Deltaproteobacteria bacterium]